VPAGMSTPTRTAGVSFRDRIGTPLVGTAPKVMLLGSGELGREIAIEAMRLGAEVIALDRYANAPAMQVAHRHHVVAMTDAAALRALVHREAPDVIVPEIEQIATAELVRLEEEGWTVIPRAESTRATMDRERIRRLATEKAHVKASAFAMVESESLRLASFDASKPRDDSFYRDSRNVGLWAKKRAKQMGVDLGGKFEETVEKARSGKLIKDME